MGQPRRIKRHAQRLQAVDQCAMGGWQGLHGPGRQYRKTEDHAGYHQAQPAHLAPGGPALAAPQQQRRRRNCREQGTAQAVEQRMDLLHDDAGERQGEAEDDDAQQAEGHAGVFARAHEGDPNLEGFKGSPSSHNPRRLLAYSWVRIYPYSFNRSGWQCRRLRRLARARRLPQKIASKWRSMWELSSFSEAAKGAPRSCRQTHTPAAPNLRRTA